MTNSRSPTPMYDFLREVQEEFNGFMLGDYLGGGEHRAVYALGSGDANVLKVERPSDHKEFCNMVEWQVWSHLCDSEAGKWLAPCCDISRQGTFLVQRRCEPLAPDKIPARIPWFCTDVHEGNWGLFEGRPVLFDYGFLFGFLEPAKKDKLRLLSRAHIARRAKTT